MHVSDLRGILQYIPRFREKTFVIAIDGEIVDGENFSNVLRRPGGAALAQHQGGHRPRGAVTRSSARAAAAGTPVFQFRRLRHPPTRRRSRSASTPPRASRTRSWKASPSVEPARHLRQRRHRLPRRHPRRRRSTAHRQDRPRRRRQPCNSFWIRGMIPVLPPLGFDGDGRTYRINSDTVAVEVAEALRAAKIIFLCENGALKSDGSLVRQLSVEEAEELVRKHRLSTEQKGPRPQARKPPPAPAAQGVPRVHLLDGPRQRGPAGRTLQQRGHRHDGPL